MSGDPTPSGARQRVNLYGMDVEQLGAVLSAFATRPFHAAQLYRWMYGHHVTDIGQMTDLPAALRTPMAERFIIARPALREVVDAADGTRKYLLRLEDGLEIEAIYIVHGRRTTLCLSSEIGCPFDCRFCLTGTMALRRQLTAGEIVGQVAVLSQDNGIDPKTVRVVFMGMGEPLHNYDAVMRAFRILVDRHGFGIPSRRVTLSTAGVVPGIDRLAGEPLRPRLAISLGAADNSLRSRLMPINRRYNLGQLMEACRRFPLRPRERITFEYVLLAGQNDSSEQARGLGRLLHGVRCKVNVIPYNETGMPGFETPSRERVVRFRDALLEQGVPASVRWSKGRDIGAACGQLARVPGVKKSPG